MKEETLLHVVCLLVVLSLTTKMLASRRWVVNKVNTLSGDGLRACHAAADDEHIRGQCPS
jgi:hypothetical protein